MNVGDYVRTKYGISKIENISPNEYDKEHDYVELETFVFDGLDIQVFFTTDEIIKSSPNIIDLIEVGDYVNGYKIVKKNKYTLYLEDGLDEESNLYIGQDNIKSIVTKEQFESMKYNLESEVN